MSDMHDAAQQPLTKADLLAALASFGAEFKAENESMRTEFRADGQSTREEFRSAFQTGTQQLREESRSAFQAGTQKLREEFRSDFKRIFVMLAHHSSELADIRGYIKDKLVTREEFHSRMDGFTGRVDDFDYSAAKNRARLDDHEKRLTALEKKPS